jgi:predicted amidohydrolase YtcJ
MAMARNLMVPMLIGMTLAPLGSQPLADVDTADAVYLNGEVYAGNARNPWTSAIVVDDGKIIYVGDDPEEYIDSETKVFDLEGRLVIPGIIDAHSHPGMVALSGGQLDLGEVTTKEELLLSIENLVSSNPDRDVLMGGFWPNEVFDVSGPKKEDLDKIESDRPVIFYDDWGHTVWANSAALAVAGVTSETEDLVPGFSFYQKDKDGEPTGWITESAASVFVNNFQSVTPSVEQLLLEYLEYYRSVGVTTVLDAGNFGLDQEVFAAVSRLDKKGQLPVRYHGAYTLFVPNDLPMAIGKLKELGRQFNSEMVRIDTLKLFFDGVLETRTAAISSDYLDTPGNSGEALLGREQVHQLILELEEEGFNLHVHAVGDRATTTILDAVQDAHESLSRAPSIRIAICHLEVVKKTDFERFRQLGVIAQLTPHWAVGGDRTWVEQGIGSAVFDMQRSQPFISDGALVTFSSDITTESEWKSDRANPFLGMQVGHNRQDVGVGPDGEYLPPLSEQLRLTDLVNGYTSNAAYQLGIENEIGTIAVGHQADFLVLNQNLFEVNRYDIHKTKPVAVVINGSIVSGAIVP